MSSHFLGAAVKKWREPHGSLHGASAVKNDRASAGVRRGAVTAVRTETRNGTAASQACTELAGEIVSRSGSSLTGKTGPPALLSETTGPIYQRSR